MDSYQYIGYLKPSQKQKKLVRKYSAPREIYGNPMSRKIPGENIAEIVSCTNDVGEHDDKHYPFPHNFMWIVINKTGSYLESNGIKIPNSEVEGSIVYLNIHEKHRLVSVKRPNFQCKNSSTCTGRYGHWASVCFSYASFSVEKFHADMNNFLLRSDNEIY